MKKHILTFVGGLLLLAVASSLSHALEVEIRDLPLATIQPATYTYCESISTSSWTQFPASTVTPLQNRDGIWAYNPSGNTSNMIYAITMSSYTQSSAKPLAPDTTTQMDGIIIKGNPASTLGVPDFMRLWFLSLNATAETMCGREYRQ